MSYSILMLPISDNGYFYLNQYSYLALGIPNRLLFLHKNGNPCSLMFELLVYIDTRLVFVNFCHLSLPLGVGGWLRFVIVALPGLFYYFLVQNVRGLPSKMSFLLSD